ncbi:histidinol-phosphate phosphatase family domain-containing protein/HAD-superfamily hydrolase, subfamily IIIA [Actinoalloteichus cyanogriseus DSM 43889]|uniref:D,D-heptose 1,7-bisphosphate phosphatase n=1 Tax=Actinoalloteichus caeruleus DSM 43889 TaxID=1120930 RepID=A0ABT1JBE9_ACTCY|nr:histidinol-phosphate phosphatase family domain-containing protein/HAD-superfamily hydrolase, subfamily IIIA [Actinoalloteichus caeruleus DSM 43889]
MLFDRDGTLVEDVPYNGDPAAVRLRPGAEHVVRALRDRGIPVGLVTNQSGIGRGVLSWRQVRAVNARVSALVGGLDTVQVCPHRPDERCDCRKPRPGLVLAAAERLGVPASETWLVGDIESDVLAVRAVGGTGVLVPNGRTRAVEVRRAPCVADDLRHALRMLLDGAPRRRAVGVPAPSHVPRLPSHSAREPARLRRTPPAVDDRIRPTGGTS